MEYWNDIIKFIKDHYMFIILISGYFIQVTPIPIYPYNWFKKLSKKIIKEISDEVTKDLKKELTGVKSNLKDVNKKIDSIEEEQQKKEIKNDEIRIRDLKWRILNFSDRVDKHFYKKESFDNIYDDNLEYHQLLAKYKKNNGQVDRALDKINEYYNIYKDDPNF